MPRDWKSDSAWASAGTQVAACTAISACREAIICARKCKRRYSAIAAGSRRTSARNGQWVFPLPEKLNFAEAGPLLCGGITVFAPLVMYARPTDRVGIIGIGGLGHMAVKFAAAYGCDVTAFTSSESKFDEAKGFGANHVVSSRDSAAIKKLAGTLRSPDQHGQRAARLGRDDRHARAERPYARRRRRARTDSGRGVLADRQQRSISGSPTGSPVAIATMLDFAARHNIAPQTEHFPMSKINEAFARLESGKAHYRIVLDADF